METFRIEVGHVHGVLPGNIVGAIANEAGLDGKHIGHIDIREDHSFVDLPEGMPKEIFKGLKKVRIRGAELRITRVDSKPPRPERTGHHTRPPRSDSAPHGSHPRKHGSQQRPHGPRSAGRSDQRSHSAGRKRPARREG
jgi:ATP-dependent RNA helicase DeaD